MRILFVTTCYPDEKRPQYCIFLEQQAKALVGLSNCVDVLFIKEGGVVAEEYFYNGIKVYKYPVSVPKKYETLVLSTLSKTETRGIEQIISDNYDIVSFHFGGKKITRSIIDICKKVKIPFVLHFHGLNVWYEETEKNKLLYNWYRFQNRIIYKKVNAVVGVSNKVVERFKEKIKTVPIYTVYNGVDISRFLFRERTRINMPLKILCVANLISLKGQDYLIQAVSKLKKSGIDCSVKFIGDGIKEQEYKRLVNKLSLSDSVEFTGVLDYQAVAENMNTADIFVMPSYYEALGCVYLEAMACGMITVGVSSQGIDEIIKPNKNGFLISPKDVNSIVDIIRKISGLSPDELSRISKAAKSTAERFTWENSAVELNEVFKKTVARFREEKNERV